MSRPVNRRRDPEKRAARRQAQRDALARGAMPTTPKAERPSQSQVNHASNPKDVKHRREAERRGDR